MTYTLEPERGLAMPDLFELHAVWRGHAEVTTTATVAEAYELLKRAIEAGAHYVSLEFERPKRHVAGGQQNG